MSSKFERDSLRIIDANFNRAKEGLRVCEEICRFHLNSRLLSRRLNILRHNLTNIVINSGLEMEMLLEARDSKQDCGKNFSFGPGRKNFKAVLNANAQRVKEALRVLEEFFKPFDKGTPKKIQKLRFQFYEFEKKVMDKFRALSHTGY